MLRGISLQRQLRLASLILSFLASVCAAVAIFAVWQSRATLQQALDRQIPFFEQTQNLTRDVERAVSQVFVAFSLSSTDEQNSSAEAWEALDAATSRDLLALERLELSEDLGSLKQHLEELASARALIIDMLIKRHRLRAKQAKGIRQLKDVQEQMLEVVDTMLSSRDPRRPHGAEANALTELRRATVAISTTLLALPSETREAQIKLADVRTRSYVRRADRLLASLPEKPAAFFATNIARIESSGTGSGSLSLLREAENLITTDALRLRQDVRQLARLIGEDLDTISQVSLRSFTERVAAEQKLQWLLVILVSALATSSAAAVLLFRGFVLNRGLIQPLALVNRGIQEFEQSGTLMDVRSLPDNEIGRVARTFRSMTEHRLCAEQEREAQNEQLSLLNTALEAANREQAEFTYAISHDLKSPTNTVRMLLQELREVMDDRLDENDTELLDDLDTTTARMARLVEDVLTYARSVGENMEVETIDLRVEVKAILQDLSGDIAAAGAEIQIGDLPKVTGNAMQLRLLMQNLISNAIKFRHSGRQPLIEVSEVESEEPGHIAIEVRDNGIGIDPAYHDQIFRLFRRLHTHGTYQGSGIGLTICQRIISNHRGRIEVSSQDKIGSIFTILLPKETNGGQNS